MATNSVAGRILFVIAMFFFGIEALAEEQKPEENIAEILMNSTFKLESEGIKGTGFLLGKPYSINGKPAIVDGEQQAAYVLITAAHVLENFTGEFMDINIRRRVNNVIVKDKRIERIRQDGSALWTKHKSVDIAAMYVKMPKDLEGTMLSVDALATDELLTKFEIGPADQLFAIGFPYGLNVYEPGYPLIRSGVLATYPITPTLEKQFFLFDFEIFPGNSGSPVFIQERSRLLSDGNFYKLQTVVGIVSEEIKNKTTTVSDVKTEVLSERLHLAIVFHASLIRQTIESMPEYKE